jgi:hypothetical protein
MPDPNRRDVITPTVMLAAADQCLHNASLSLSDAADWLRSDWPCDTTLTAEQADRRRRMNEAIATAKKVIEEARHG